MRKAITAAAMAAFLISGSALGQEACAPLKEMRSYLEERFSENVGAVLVVGDDGALVIFANPETETWSLVSVGTDGTACLIGAGVGFVFPRLNKPSDPA